MAATAPFWSTWSNMPANVIAAFFAPQPGCTPPAISPRRWCKRRAVRQRGGMGHAGELETAMILHLRPDLVQMDKVVDETAFISTPSYFMDWVEGGDLVANPPWDDDTATGAYGAGSLATAANGQRWLEAGIAEKAAHVHEIHEQQRRRQERRRQGFGLWGKMGRYRQFS